MRGKGSPRGTDIAAMFSHIIWCYTPVCKPKVNAMQFYFISSCSISITSLISNILETIPVPSRQPYGFAMCTVYPEPETSSCSYREREREREIERERKRDRGKTMKYII